LLGFGTEHLYLTPSAVSCCKLLEKMSESCF